MHIYLYRFNVPFTYIHT